MSVRAKKVLGEQRCGICKRKYPVNGDYLCPACRERLAAKRAADDIKKERDGWNMALLRTRREREMTIPDVAKRANVTQYAYKKFEQGKSDPPTSVRVRIARALGARPEELWPYAHLVRCRTCMKYFETETEVTCPACKEAARREAESRVSRLTGANQHKIAVFDAEAKRHGMTYGQYEGMLNERRCNHG